MDVVIRTSEVVSNSRRESRHTEAAVPVTRDGHKRAGVWLHMLLLLAAGPLLASAPAKLLRVGNDRIPGEYIVVFADDVLPERVPEVAADIAASRGATVKKVWQHAVRGFAATMHESDAEVISRLPSVRYVEENAHWYLSTTQQTNVNPATCDPVAGTCPSETDNRLWHLDRTDQNFASPTHTYSYCTDGTGVTVYVVDTGVNRFHAEFGPTGARVQVGYNASGDFMPANDPCMGFALPPVAPYDYLEDDLYLSEVLERGHGTSVASALGGRRSGVAKNVTIVPIKVVRCDRQSARARISNRYYQQYETMFRPPTSSSIGPLYRAQNAGYSASSDPGGWPDTAGATIADGDVTWEVVPISEYSPTLLVSTQVLVDGLNWILSPANPGPKSHAVVTLSTYRRATVQGVAGETGTVEAAIRSLLASNITVIASANNQNGNACDTSPARLSINNPDPALANDVITVGGSMPFNRPWTVDISDVPDAVEADGPVSSTTFYGVEPAYDPSRPVGDARWLCGPGDSAIRCSNTTPTSTPNPGGSVNAYHGFNGGSNGGPCVTLFAPAKNVFVATPASASSYRDARVRGGHASGTSWSAPIAAGFAARILQTNPTYAPAQVRASLLANSVATLEPSTLNTYDHLGVEITGTPNQVLRLGDVNIASHPMSTAAAMSGPTTLSLVASGTTGFTYQWYEVNSGFDYATYKHGAHASTPISGATFSTFAAPESSVTKAYWARVSNTCGSADTTVAVVVPRPSAPTNVRVAAQGGSATVTWAASPGVEKYEIHRLASGQPWTITARVDGATLAFAENPGSMPGGMIVYRVVALTGAAYLPPEQLASSTPSASDFGNLNDATYEPLGSATLIKAQHIAELRQAINALSDAIGVARPYADADVLVSSLQGKIARATDLTSLLAEINTLRTNALFTLAPASFGETPAPGVRVRAQHIEDLRSALR